ncbi:AI-2E family transporter [Patescibacteria group bacterium]
MKTEIPKKIEISHKTIIFTVVFLLALWLVFFIRDIIFQLFVALILMAILNPFVSKLEKFHIPRAVSIFLTYFVFIFLITVAVVGIIPPLAEQTTNFVSTAPELIEEISGSFVYGDQILGESISQLSSVPATLAKHSISIFGNFASIAMILIIAFYLLLSRNKLDRQVGEYFGEANNKEFRRILGLVESKLGGWVTGQLALMFLVGLTTYLGLILLGMPFALPLAILAGLLELVPYIGPILAMIPAAIIGFGVSPLVGFATIALYVLIQQVENYVFVPKVMEKSAGVNPIITLLALAIGLKLAGMLGILVSVPVVIVLQIMIKEYMARA